MNDKPHREGAEFEFWQHRLHRLFVGHHNPLSCADADHGGDRFALGHQRVRSQRQQLPPPIHTYPEGSFVYRLELPPRETLLNMVRGAEVFGQSEISDGVRWVIDPDNEMMQGRQSRHLAEDGYMWLIPRGWRVTEEGCELQMILG